MDPLAIALLLFAGLAGGTIAALAGGAAIVTFPILLAVGIPPVSAAATNTVAITPGSIMAAITERSQLPPLGRTFIPMVIMSVLATLAGGALLAFTPERMFAKLIPLLLGFATVLLAYTDCINTWIKTRAAARGDHGPHRWTSTIAWLMPVSAYGGYFGAGLGVLILAVLSIGTGGDYRSANVTKNLVVGLNSLVVSVFLLHPGAGGLAARAGDDGWHDRGRLSGRPNCAMGVERGRALDGRVNRRGAHDCICMALLVLKSGGDCR